MKILDQVVTDQYALYHGDCVDVMRGMPDASVGYSIFSPPFASLYTYTNSPRDIGNVRTHAEFFEHMRFVIPELYRVTKPGRLVSFHCMDLPTSKARDGFIGLTDFAGALLRAFEECGWIYHSRVCIWKDPVVSMQRTKAIGLLWKQLKKDSALSRQGIADYVITMRRPGENPEPISHTETEFPVEMWQRYASPVWMDIDPGDTLQYTSARDAADERHICALQLEVYRRGIELWSNPGDVVWEPFGGIGSGGHIAVGGPTRSGARLAAPRRYASAELKHSYWKQAVRNLQNATSQTSLFDSAQNASAAG